MRATLIITAAFAALSILPGAAWAQANRTFVSGQGSDTNPCSLSAPCRSFAQALTQTNAGGEITILDPAGYGPVIISKTVSIINDGVGEAGVTTSAAGDAITISAGASDAVSLRGLTLVGGGIGTNGVKINSAGTVNIQNSVIRGFAQSGIFLVSSNSGSSILTVVDSTISNNTTNGINVQPSGSNLAARAVFKRVQVIGNGANGIFLYGGSVTGTSSMKGTAIDTLASGNGTGFNVSTGASSTSPTNFELINCQAVDNAVGVTTFLGDVNMFLAQTTISDNSQNGYLANNGIMYTFGNNYIAPNDTNFGFLTPIGQQ